MAEPWRGPEEWARMTTPSYLSTEARAEVADAFRLYGEQVRERCAEEAGYPDGPRIRSLDLDTGEVAP